MTFPIPPAIRRATLAAALLAACPVGAWAVEPRAAISGPATARVGSTVMLDGTSSVNDAEYPLQWRPFDRTIMGELEALDKGGRANVKLAFTPSKAGVYSFAILAQGVPAGQAKAKSDFATFTVTVADDTPAPAPQPTPDPTPPIIPPVDPPKPPTPPVPVYPPGSDQAIGLDWMTQLNVGAATVLDSAAAGNWTTTDELTTQMVAGFDNVFATVWVTAADSLQGVAGPVSKGPVQPAVKEAIKLKLKGLAAGARGAAR